MGKYRVLCSSHYAQRRRGVKLHPIRGYYVRPIVAHPADPTLALVELTKGKWAVIDAADSIEVGRHNWCAAEHKGRWYAKTKVTGEARMISLHRFVGQLAGLDTQKLVDHRISNGLDCRRSNLRAATHSQNAWNQTIRKDSKTGIKGVCVRGKKFHAQVTANRTTHFLGLFATAEEAGAAVAAARERLHGEFANHGAS